MIPFKIQKQPRNNSKPKISGILGQLVQDVSSARKFRGHTRARSYSN